MVRLRPITNVLGILLIILGAMMLSCILFSIQFETDDLRGLIRAGSVTIGAGALLSIYRKGKTSINKREGYLIVALGWLTMVIFGSLPYIMTGVTDSLHDAFFESASGFTTTGATIFNDIEVLPRGLLFWRSLTQWIGGMGIIVLTVAIFPLLGIGGIELFVAESPGPTSDKIHPRITVTARRLWYIYVGLTGMLIAILNIAGMTFYDAINHAFTTMSTGGFSTYNSSMGAFPAHIQYIVILFMFIGGTNYTVLYFALNRRFKKVWASDEFRAYLSVVLLMCLAVSATLIFKVDHPVEQSIREASFHVISLMTTTGYVVSDYTTWGIGLTVFFFTLLFAGACAGSTSGGIKIVRHLVFFKNSILEFKRILHPRAVIRIKINQQIVAARILTHILVFLLVYLGIIVIGTVVTSALGMDFTSAISATASAVGNVGPGIGGVGPAHTFAHIPSAAKVFLSFLMILGRLELFTILVLFTPYFWKAT